MAAGSWPAQPLVRLTDLLRGFKNFDYAEEPLSKWSRPYTAPEQLTGGAVLANSSYCRADANYELAGEGNTYLSGSTPARSQVTALVGDRDRLS